VNVGTFGVELPPPVFLAKNPLGKKIFNHIDYEQWIALCALIYSACERRKKIPCGKTTGHIAKNCFRVEESERNPVTFLVSRKFAYQAGQRVLVFCDNAGTIGAKKKKAGVLMTTGEEGKKVKRSRIAPMEVFDTKH
jgi:hypothetical protein